MTPLDLIIELQDRGVTLARDGDRLRWRAPKGALNPDLFARLTSQEWAILATLLAARQKDPEFWMFCFNERAAIMQICGGLSRERAERLAFEVLLDMERDWPH
jgi:TubC N-terminal docking domain